MTLAQLEYVLAVHKYGSFTEAAKRCFVTQPSLSTQIQNIERELDVVLFDRSKTPIAPTTMGRKIIEQAVIVLAESRKLTDTAKEWRREIKGPFRLGVIPTVAPYLLPLFLKEFSAKYPKVDLTIEEKPTAVLLPELERDEIDAALMAPTESMANSLVSRVLFYEPFLLFVSHDHPLHRRKEICPDELPSKGLWLIGESHCLREQTLALCKNRRTAGQVFDNVDFASGSLETVKNLIRKNSGYTLIPRLAALTLDPKEHSNYVRSFSKPIPTRKIAMISNSIQHKNPIREKLCEEILASLPADIPRTERGIEVIELK